MPPGMNNALKALVSVNKQSLLRYTQTVNYPVAAGRIVFYMRHSCAIRITYSGAGTNLKVGGGAPIRREAMSPRGLINKKLY